MTLTPENLFRSAAAAAAAILTASAGAWGQCEVTIVSEALSPNFATSASMDGDLAVIGALRKERALVYRREGGEWLEEAALTVPEAFNNIFGESVSIYGERVLVGDYQFPGGSGAAYVFRREAPGQWVLEDKLVADDGFADQRFGYRVALSGDRALVTALRDKTFGDWSGAAYVFQFENGAWKQQAKLLAPDGGAGHLFGWSASLDQDRAVVGAIQFPGGGRAYIFSRSGGTWSHAASLDVFDFEGQPFQFGESVSIRGDDVAVGSWNGRVWIYQSTEGGWIPDAVIKPEQTLGCFGRAAELGAGRLLVGAPCTAMWGTDAGAAAIFERIGDSWVQRSHFVGSQVKPTDWFGSFVAIDGTSAVVGEIQNEGGHSQAYFFDLSPACLPCYADLDGSGDLDLFDFLAFNNAFNAGDSAADCDASGSFSLFDFLCFVNAFNQGC